MKTVISIGVGVMLFLYLIMSMYNHTWDLMNYSKDTVYWFGSLSFLGWVVPAAFRYLNQETWW